ncbi:MAG: NAD(P)H-dependent oxidoreductase subunit E [Betaproteobacteria bacterium]|nr:NAD(P)H-dependent oxidoreductase subunit E [Betaproteobacteria bacterium]
MTDLASLLERHGCRPEQLLQILIEIQARAQWVSPEAQQQVADALGLPLARVQGVIGFYAFLSDRPWGRYRVLFSDNVTDRMLGSRELLDRLCARLWVERGHVSGDGLVSVDFTSCTGLCDQGPGLLVNGHAIPRLTCERVDRIADLILAQQPLEAWPADLFDIEDNVRRADLLLGHDLALGEILRSVRAATPEAILAEIKKSGLRGRGGAGFATGLKWEACRAAPGAQRYVVCNADEGEPGTFKDRVLLTRQADLVFDGMSVCAWAIGASQGFLYLRGEYRHLLEPLNAALARRRAAGLLGRGFDIEIHLGAGAYVCGEESALIESLEGKRGVPRNRPPYPVTHGYLQRPTVVNNVETFAAAALIAHHGADAYRALGTAKSAGTKLLSVAGDCARPGIYEYPFGVTVRQVLADCHAEDAQAVQISGPSGVCIDASEFDRRIAFEDLPTAGAFTVFGPGRDLFEMARAYTDFFAHESCGFCTPCRVGTAMLKGVMDKIAGGHGAPCDLAEIEKLDKVLHQSAHCGLGHTACNPTLDTLKRFKPTYVRRLKHQDFEPAFDLDGALERARQMTGRDDVGAHLGEETVE